jgi:RNA polymerase sigma-70 factor (ECF subfamily)
MGIRRGAANHGLALSINVTRVNGGPAMVVFNGDRIDSVYVCSIANDRIVAFHVVRNPDKLEFLKGQLRS